MEKGQKEWFYHLDGTIERVEEVSGTRIVKGIVHDRELRIEFLPITFLQLHCNVMDKSVPLAMQA